MLRIRAKTVMKLHTDTVNIDLTFPKGQSIEAVFKNILTLVQDRETVERVEALVAEHKEGLLS
jgi:hypothetical protein